MQHDFIEEEVNIDGTFVGDLYKCKNCDKEHLCSQRQLTGSNCSHTQQFYEGCEEAKNT